MLFNGKTAKWGLENMRTGDEETAGSNPVTPTKNNPRKSASHSGLRRLIFLGYVLKYPVKMCEILILYRSKYRSKKPPMFTVSFFVRIPLFY